MIFCLAGQRRTARLADFVFFIAVLVLFSAAPAQATIQYAVSVAQPEQHLFHVTMTIPAVRGEATVQLPAWNALYQVRDFSFHVMHLGATDERGNNLPVTRVDKQTWRIGGTGTSIVQYTTYWDEPGPFNSQLDRTHAFLNLATVLLYVPERRGEDVRIAFCDLPPGWRLAVELPPAANPQNSISLTFAAANYDALVDAPVEMGTFEEFRLERSLAPVRVVVHGDHWNREQLSDLLRRIVGYETQLMRGAPFSEYLFIFHIGSGAQGAGGGMEHANSTAIFAESGSRLADVTAHEFFHLWNVKRIRPQSLEPVDYAREQWTRALWFAEGVTSTYAAYTLVRTGLWTRRDFLDHLAAAITELESRPARKWQSVEESSLNAWLERYPIYQLPEFSISYYNKGELVGLLLDIEIREATDNRASMDDVLRALNNEFARQGRLYRDSGDIRAIAERIAGRSLEDFFARYVSGVEEVPWDDFLGRAGLMLKPRGRRRASFEFRIARGPNGASVALRVVPESRAALAGVREGDLLVQLNGTAFPRNVERWLREHQPGEKVRLRLRRDSVEREVSFVLGEDVERGYEIEEIGQPAEKQGRIREGLLGGTTDSPQM